MSRALPCRRRYRGDRYRFSKSAALLIFCWMFWAPLASGLSDRAFSGLTDLLGPRDAAMVAAADGRILFAHNPEIELVPASTIKILTALAAFHYLGPDFRFTTGFYLANDGSLKIKGQGDPLLISEIVREIAATLAGELNGSERRLNHIILDNTFFDTPISIPGVSDSSEPFDAPVGALCVNFNTVNFKQHQGTYISAEPQTPLIPMVLPGIEASGLQKGRITLSHQQDEITYYAGYLFKYFLEASGFSFTGQIKIDPVLSQDRLVLEYRSRFTLDQIVARMLEYSNNFIANQIFLRTGARQHGAPGRLENGAQAVQAYARDELGLDHVAVVEGSGISRLNRVSARQMLAVLEAFEPHHALMKSKDGHFFKTGHLRGIRSQAGYYRVPEKGLYRYVILLNTPGKSMHPVLKRLLQVFQDGR